MMQTSPHSPVTSKDNSTVKYLRSLIEPKYRKKEKAFLIEGLKVVEEALRDNLGVTMLAAAPSLTQHHGKGVLKLAESRGVDIVWISERLMDALSENKTPQPAIAVVRTKEHSEEGLIANEASLIIIAHQLQDPGNLGAIIRTAEAAGASGVAITHGTVDPYNPKAVRASMGSILRVPVVVAPDAAGFMKKCKQMGFQIAATVAAGGKTHFDADLKKPTAVIFGQEGSGLAQDILGEIDLQLHIPMAHTIDSLNVAASAAIILYEAMRQRQKK